MEKLINEAIEILKLNYKDGFTIPTAKLYPFQWNWDSGFTAIGQSHFSLDYAITELTSLFCGQWENGMIPHIIFHSENEKTYFPNHDFWKAEVNAGAPKTLKTSGITQPPVHGFVLEHMLKIFPDDEKLKSFAREIFPKIVQSHRFFYTYRDPKNEGLCFIFHPWESGRDNSPLWDESMDRMKIEPGDIPQYIRKDTKLAAADERPTSEQYDRYVYLLELGKKYKYDEQGIFDESPFLVQDTLMNAILIRSNEALINIAKLLNKDYAELSEWQQQSTKAFQEKLWNNELNQFCSYDLRAEHSIAMKEVGSYISLFANVASSDQATTLKKQLEELHNRGFYLCPSFDVDNERFDSKRYWRGPIWPQINWMIHQGCMDYGFTDLANIVKSDFLEIIKNQGFYEYFESQKSISQKLSKGYGGDKFTWTAACVLDFIKQG